MLESRYLKDNIENIQKLLAIPALKNFETKSLGKLLRLSKIREYQDGEIIIKEGDRDPWLYFLLSGTIKITKEGLEIVIKHSDNELAAKYSQIVGLEATQELLPTYVGCGECCRKSAPTLGQEDLVLLREEALPWAELVTLREGEPARSPFEGLRR